jgi:hypothetical protein
MRPFVALFLSGLSEERRHSDQVPAVESPQIYRGRRRIPKMSDGFNRRGPMLRNILAECEGFGFKRFQTNAPPSLGIAIEKSANF